jgi:hypothetical protein
MRTLCFILGIALTAAGNTQAIDHSNLDEGRPLRLEDPYPIAHGEWAIEAGIGFLSERQGPDRGILPIEFLYGAAPNLHLRLGTTLSTDPHEVDEPTRSGDLRLGGLYNFNQETLALPAFGFEAMLNLPSGVDSSGLDVRVKGLLTKSFDRLRLHANGGYEFLNGTKRGERDGRYDIVLGASYPVGAPKYTRLTVLGDVFTESSVRRGDSNTVGAEIGFRYQLTLRAVWDAGIGSEFTGPSGRSSFFLIMGLSVGF